MYIFICLVVNHTQTINLQIVV